MPTKEKTSPDTRTDASGGSAVGDIQRQTRPIAEQAQQTASQVTDQAKQQATSLAQTQKSKASESLGQMSQALQQSSQQLQRQGQSMPAQALTTTGQQVQQLATYLDTHDVPEIVGEIEDFGRRQPGIFLGGAFALGLLLARFLKSSPPTQPSSTQGKGGQ